MSRRSWLFLSVTTGIVLAILLSINILGRLTSDTPSELALHPRLKNIKAETHETYVKLTWTGLPETKQVRIEAWRPRGFEPHSVVYLGYSTPNCINCKHYFDHKLECGNVYDFLMYGEGDGETYRDGWGKPSAIYDKQLAPCSGET